jgi:hypothetical protein
VFYLSENSSCQTIKQEKLSIAKRINNLIINGESNELIDGENFEFNG